MPLFALTVQLMAYNNADENILQEYIVESLIR